MDQVHLQVCLGLQHSIEILRLTLAYFNLLTHALFKALLFICAGVVIHSRKDSQDIRFIGNIYFQIPLTCVHSSDGY